MLIRRQKLRLESVGYDMRDYKNMSGRSGVREYEINSNFIEIRFSDRSFYRYSSSSAGALCFSEMKRLAEEGWGLNTFINKRCKKGYYQKGKY